MSPILIIIMFSELYNKYQNVEPLTYAVNDDMGVHVSQTVYGDEDETGNGFHMAGTNMDGSYGTTGNLGYLNGGDEQLSYGLTYNMGGISLGATMHNVKNTDDDTTHS